MPTLQALLEEIMHANQKLQDRVKYLDNIYTKGKKKIIFEDEIVEISSAGDGNSDNKGNEASRRTREPTISILEYKQIMGIKHRVEKLSKELKYVTKYAKIRDLPICNRKDPK